MLAKVGPDAVVHRFCFALKKRKNCVEILVYIPIIWGTFRIHCLNDLTCLYRFRSGTGPGDTGTQRFCMEHRVRVAKISNIFLTRVAPECVGGLPGMIRPDFCDTQTISFCLPWSDHGKVALP